MERRNWLITGISSGFGRIMAEELLARGDNVAGTLRDVSSASDLKTIHGSRLWLAKLDLCETGAIRHVVDSAWQAFGRIDVVVSNGGHGLMGAVEEFSDEQVWQQIDSHLLASIQLIRAALPHLRAQNGGRILQLSSSRTQAMGKGGSLYHATQWGIEGFVDALAREVGAIGIECTLVETGDADLRDPVETVDAMIESIEQKPAPRRLMPDDDLYGFAHTSAAGWGEVSALF